MKFKSLKLDQLTDAEVLFFIRIRGKSSYFKNVYTDKFLDQFKSIEEFRCISEYKKDADVCIDLNSISRDYLYEKEYEKLIELSSVESLIKRCRGLRAIPYISAVKLINRAFLFFDHFYLSNPQLSLIVTGAIDNYVMDLMVLVGESYGIKFIGVTDSFMSPEYKLITVRGELSDFNPVSTEEINKFTNKVVKSIDACATPKIKSIIFKGVYNYFSYLYRFFIRYLFKYKVLGRLEYEYRFAPYLHGFKSIRQILGLKYLISDISFFGESRKPKAYIPLHWYPEATTDYWINSIYHIDYQASVLSTIKRLQNLGYEVFAKEHPHFLLNREESFYKIVKETGCHLISPFVCTKKVFDLVDLVTVWNGSTGIEALIYGKETRKVVNSYYGDGLVSDLSEEEVDDSLEKRKVVAEKCIEKVLSSSFNTLESKVVSKSKQC